MEKNKEGKIPNWEVGREQSGCHSQCADDSKWSIFMHLLYLYFTHPWKAMSCLKKGCWTAFSGHNEGSKICCPYPHTVSLNVRSYVPTLRLKIGFPLLLHLQECLGLLRMYQRDGQCNLIKCYTLCNWEIRILTKWPTYPIHGKLPSCPMKLIWSFKFGLIKLDVFPTGGENVRGYTVKLHSYQRMICPWQKVESMPFIFRS